LTWSERGGAGSGRSAEKKGAKVLLETVRRFKALERHGVILTASDDLPEGEEGRCRPQTI
jgi:hypothetical protein